jgi:hypothetical protein
VAFLFPLWGLFGNVWVHGLRIVGRAAQIRSERVRLQGGEEQFRVFFDRTEVLQRGGSRKRNSIQITVHISFDKRIHIRCRAGGELLVYRFQM